ncbi:MAG: GNAT family N-acetyltransferase [Chlamydiia bacterium]|nr:GNAT family N-acetyltransferase [Chlamydiia bacterium]
MTITAAPQNKEQLAPLFDPATYQQFLHAEDPDDEICLVAYDNDQPIGLVWATLFPPILDAFLHTLFVLPEHRHRGVGKELMQTLYAKLNEHKITTVSTHYPQTETTPYFQNILSQDRWTKPDPYGTRFTVHIPTFEPPWYNPQYRLLPTYSIFPWSRVTKTEQKHIDQQEEREFFPIDVSPLGDETLIEPLNSLGMRFNGKLIGWMITHRLNKETICYTALYVEHHHRYTGVAIYLLIEAIKRQKRSSIPYAQFDLDTTQADRHWIRFVQNRLAPYAQSQTPLIFQEKTL